VLLVMLLSYSQARGAGKGVRGTYSTGKPYPSHRLLPHHARAVGARAAALGGGGGRVRAQAIVPIEGRGLRPELVVATLILLHRPGLPDLAVPDVVDLHAWRVELLALAACRLPR
jgi:hypothetical protein